jgi:hypothetical protein
MVGAKQGKSKKEKKFEPVPKPPERIEKARET